MASCLWITGAGSGIGLALAQRWASQGRTVIASGRREKPLEELAHAFPSGRVHAYPLDVTNRAAVLDAVSAIENEVGPIETAVLCAGTHIKTSAQTFSSETVEALFQTNVMGSVHALEALLPRMITRQAGHIALVSSVAGYRGLPTAAAYSATKAALIALAEGLKFDLDRENVKISVICPGFVKTPLTDRNDFPMPEMISAEDAAAAIERGLTSGRFRIAFPTRFAWAMRFLRLLPDPLYFSLMRRRTKR